MDEHRGTASPEVLARIGGALYLFIIVPGFFVEAIRNRIVVSADAAATAANLASMESLWRIGIVVEVFELLCALGLAMIYFVLLRPVNKELNLLATFIRLVAISVQAVAVLHLAEALFPLGTADSLQAFTPDQLHALTRMALRAHAYGFSLALLFFGCTFLFHGYLIFRSGFLPKVLGVLIQIAGVCYMTNSLAVFLAPTLADRLFPAILLPAFIAETSLCLWLLVKGVNGEKWRALAAQG
jgi:Domain of unknown function (DUF4386)